MVLSKELASKQDFGSIKISAGTKDRINEASVASHSTNIRVESDGPVFVHWLGPYEDDEFRPAEVCVHLVYSDYVWDGNLLHKTTKKTQRIGRATISVPFLIELATYALESRTYRLPDETRENLLSAIEIARGEPDYK